jgi:hypothetical protein
MQILFRCFRGTGDSPETANLYDFWFLTWQWGGLLSQFTIETLEKYDQDQYGFGKTEEI